MKISMYDACVKPGIRMMNNLAAVLEKTAQHAQARKIDPEVLLGARLAPDMFPLARQVQIASDSAKMGAARVAGVEAPAYEDNEKSLPELIERAKKTAAYLETLKPQQFEGSEDRTVKWTGDHPLGHALATYWGDDPLAASEGERAAWDCPACGPAHRHRFRLTVPLRVDGDPPRDGRTAQPYRRDRRVRRRGRARRLRRILEGEKGARA